MAKNQVYMPSGTGGLVRYQESGEEKVKVKPMHVVYIVAGLTVFEFLIKLIF